MPVRTLPSQASTLQFLKSFRSVDQLSDIQMPNTVTPGPPSGTSYSAYSEAGPALRIRGLLPPQPRAPATIKPGVVDVSLLGITIVIGGQYFNWNATLAAGLLPATTAFLLVGGAYVVLLFSLAEVASVFPFGGGAYAITRKSLGFFGGFMVGAIDAVEFIIYVAASLLALGDMVVTSIPRLRGLEPVVWLLFFLSATLFQTRSHALFWRVNSLLSVSSLLILLMFCFGSLARCDINKLSVGVIDMQTRTPSDSPKISDMLRVLPFCAWFFVGVDAIVMVADNVTDPREVIPLAQRSCMTILVVTAVFTFFVTASLPPGTSVMADATAPLSYGFTGFLNLSVSDAALLSLPATYATAFGFLWAYGRLFTALAASGLLPRPISARIHQQVRQNHSVSSRTAIGIGSIVCFLVCLVIHYAFDDLQVASKVCIGLAFLSYILQTLGFVALRNGGATGRGNALAQASYRSPFGVWGAFFSLIVWVLGLLSVVGFQDKGYRELIVVLVIVVVLTVYYYVYAQHHQVISNDERSIVLTSPVPPRPSARTVANASQTQSQASSAKSIKSNDGSAKHKPPRISIQSDADSSFTVTSNVAGGMRTSSGSMRVSMPELVQAEKRLNNLLEEYPDLTDDTEEPYVRDWPPAQETRAHTERDDDGESSESGIAPLRSAVPLKRAGSDGQLASGGSADTAGQQSHNSGAGTLFTGGWGRSFLPRNMRLEKLREETERDLRSAISGIWPSERSARWSRGRAS